MLEAFSATLTATLGLDTFFSIAEPNEDILLPILDGKNLAAKLNTFFNPFCTQPITEPTAAIGLEATAFTPFHTEDATPVRPPHTNDAALVAPCHAEDNHPPRKPFPVLALTGLPVLGSIVVCILPGAFKKSGIWLFVN